MNIIPLDVPKISARMIPASGNLNNHNNKISIKSSGSHKCS